MKDICNNDVRIGDCVYTGSGIGKVISLNPFAIQYERFKSKSVNLAHLVKVDRYDFSLFEITGNTVQIGDFVVIVDDKMSFNIGILAGDKLVYTSYGFVSINHCIKLETMNEYTDKEFIKLMNEYQMINNINYDRYRLNRGDIIRAKGYYYLYLGRVSVHKEKSGEYILLNKGKENTYLRIDNNIKTGLSLINRLSFYKDDIMETFTHIIKFGRFKSKNSINGIIHREKIKDVDKYIGNVDISSLSLVYINRLNQCKLMDGKYTLYRLTFL